MKDPSMNSLLRSLLVALALLVPAAPAFAEDAGATAAAKAPAQVVSFTDEAALNALAAKGTTVVFFYASWCPNCRATVTELNARWDEVRPGLTLVIADYDTEKALKAKYGITYQDTFVLLDAKGNGVKVWNSGGVNGLNANTQG
jgi:thiol-disulfide isomerase/thioredoxin